MLNCNDICLWSIDAKTLKTIEISPVCENIFGFTQKEFLEQTFSWEKHTYSYDLGYVLSKKHLLDKGEILNLEYRIIHKNGRVRWVSDTIAPIFKNETNQLIRFDRIIRDITSRKETEAKLQYMAYHDYLTGLPNRRKFDEELTRALIEAKNNDNRVAVLYLDLNRFKYFNDTLGHKIGDTILQIMSDRLKGCLRKEDIISRQGGDEFVILIKGITHKAHIDTIAKKIHHLIKQPIRLLDNEFVINTSIGISIFPDHSIDADGLIRLADRAMYMAKENGTDIETFTLSMSDDFSKKLFIEQNLHKAIENNELYLVYQPIVDIYQKKTIGLEALVRWEHPQLGLVPPLEFIQVAEETHLIEKLGNWIFRQACLHRKQWEDKNLPPFYISINVSAMQMQNEFFAKMVHSTLKEFDLSPELIKIELTESAAVADIKNASSTLNTLHELGIGLNLDDFGTGYSSLGHLVSYPFQTIKIDQSFIKDLKNHRQKAICRAIVGISRNLGMKVIAEGVEEIEHMQYLCSIGCNLMQGYYFSKPVPIDKVESFFA